MTKLDGDFLKEEQDFCDAHWADLREKYRGRWIIVCKNRVVAVFSAVKDALETARLQGYQQGEYMIKEITDTDREKEAHVSMVAI